MLSIHDDGLTLCDGVTRREWLRVGGLGVCGLSLPALLAGRQASAAAERNSPKRERGKHKAKACIVLFYLGGPPQHETWDPKPDAPKEIRGSFQPIATSVPGLRVWMLTGVPHQPTNSENAKPGAPNDSPCVGAVVRRLHPGGSLPSAITLPEHIWNTGNLSWPGQDGGWLGRTADPWLIHCHPQSPGFGIPGIALPAEVPLLRFQSRHALLEQVNRHLDTVERSPALSRFDAQSQQAFNLLRAGKARRAFALQEEPDRLRERYGMNRWGQSVLLARRLVEAGVTLIQVNWTRMPGDTNDSPAWDTHGKNAERLKGHLMPVMDQAYSALLEDLEARGLLAETLVVWAGEFGRTPKINAAAGRDHWGHVFSVALAGGGVRGGVVHGASDRIGGHVKDNRVQPQDLLATIFHCLGHTPDTEVHDALGRPHPISRGTVLQQVLA